MCRLSLLFFPYLFTLPSAFCCVRIRTHARTRELASACERSPKRKKSPAVHESGRDEGQRERKGVEALEEEVRGQPHSRRSRRDAHRATPTRKSLLFETRLLRSLPSSPLQFASSSTPSSFASSYSPLFFPRSFTKYHERIPVFIFEPDCTLCVPILKIPRIST